MAFHQIYVSKFVYYQLDGLKNLIEIQVASLDNFQPVQDVPPSKIVPRLYDCGGAVDSIISILKQLHRSGLNLGFETLYDSIWHMVADLLQSKGKISGYFINSCPIAL